MTKEKLLEFYESKLSFAQLVYYKIPLWKRLLHNTLLFIIVFLLGWPTLELMLILDKPDLSLVKFIKFFAVVCGAWALAHLAIYLHGSSVAKQLKQTSPLNKFYVRKNEIDWDGFKVWQRNKLRNKLKKSGYLQKVDAESLNQYLVRWMIQERFWLVGYATLFTVIGLPIWSAFISAVFEHDVKTFIDRILLLFLFSFIAFVLCAIIKMSNEVYNKSFSKYTRISELRSVLEDVLINWKMSKNA